MNWTLLYNYVQGRCSEKELEELGVWLQEDSANEDFFTSFIEGWEEKNEISFHSDDRAAWNEFRTAYKIPGIKPEVHPDGSAQLSLSAKRVFTNRHRKKRGTAYWAYFSTAAAILV